MKSELVKARLAKLGWTTGLLAQRTGIPKDQISKVLSGERSTRWIQEAISMAVKTGGPGIPARWDLEGWRLFGALWWACQKVA